MRKAISGLTLSALLFVLCLSVEAKEANKIPRIGYLAARSGPPGGPSEEAFLQGLQSFGYVEGKTITIEWRFAQQKFERLPELANELVRLKVDAIVAASGYPTVQAAQKATTTIPIVMANVNDAVGLGLVASLSRPGGNTTGISSLTPELMGKLVELAKETIPKLARVAVLANPSISPNWKLNFKEMDGAARSLGLQLFGLEINSPDDLESAFGTARKKRADALILPPSGFLSLYRRRIVSLAMQGRLPALAGNAQWTEAGCVLAYGPSIAESYRRAAGYVDKILKGASPADLPVERPTKFDLVINLKTAKMLGLKIPESLLYRADRVIR